LGFPSKKGNQIFVVSNLTKKIGGKDYFSKDGNRFGWKGDFLFWIKTSL
jgi:hypothetical protein